MLKINCRPEDRVKFRNREIRKKIITDQEILNWKMRVKKN